MIPYIENFLTQQEADSLFASIQSREAIRHENVRNGTLIRKIHYGTWSPLPTGHSGAMLPIAEAPDYIQSLASKLSAYAGKEINYLGTLGYEDERDHILWHNHDEDVRRDALLKKLGLACADQSVWVVSLGQIREVALRPAGCKDKDKWEYLYPAHGSLYVLPSEFNVTHEHAVLDQGFPCTLRISINCKHLEPEYVKALLDKPSGKKPKTKKKSLVIATNGKQSIYCCRKECDFPADAVYVGRKYGRWPDTPFGNYKRLPGDSPEWKAEIARLMATPGFPALVEALRGKDLLCWCGPKEESRCHARAWLEIANDTNPTN